VISSNWRVSMSEVYRVLQPIRDSIIGKTNYGSSRVEEIMDWITDNDVSNFVVLDDLDLEIDNLVHIDELIGLTEANMNQAIQILNMANQRSD